MTRAELEKTRLDRALLERDNMVSYPHSPEMGGAVAVPPQEPSAVQSTLSQVRSWLGAHPQIALGGAIIIGVALGWIVKRK